MTDPTTPLSDDDLSAAIDGEATAEVLDRIEASADARARRDDLATVAAAVATLPRPTLDDAALDELITAALDAPVAPAGSAGGARRSGPPALLVAAVIAVLVAVGLGLVWSGLNGSDERAARFNTVGNSINAGGGSTGASDAADAPEAGAGAATTTAPLPGHGLATTVVPPTESSTAAPIALGTFASGDDLREALATSFAPSPSVQADPASRAPAEAAVDRCAEQLKVTLKLAGEPLNQGFATVDGRPVLVYEFASTSYADGSPTTLVAAVGEGACDQVVVFER